MAYRVLEVTLVSAKDLKRVNLITRMEVYAVVTISGDPFTRQCTPPDPYGGRHPSWNATFRFNVPPTVPASGGCLHVLLRTERALGDRDVGEVIVPMSDILAGATACDPGPRPPQSATYQVRKLHRCEPRGMLNVSYRLGPVVAPQAAVPPAPTRAAEASFPVVAYPVARPFYPPPYGYQPQQPLALPLPPHHPQAAAAGHDAMYPYPPSPAGQISTYNSPPTAYYPQAAGYAPPTPGKSNGKLELGVGLGAGLVGGAIGGMLAGDMMMSDAAAYSYGYRAGLADGGAPVYSNPHLPKAQYKAEQNRTTPV